MKTKTKCEEDVGKAVNEIRGGDDDGCALSRVFESFFGCRAPDLKILSRSMHPTKACHLVIPCLIKLVGRRLRSVHCKLSYVSSCMVSFCKGPRTEDSSWSPATMRLLLASCRDRRHKR